MALSKQTTILTVFVLFITALACVSFGDSDGNADAQIAEDEWTHVDTYQELIDECADGTLMIKVDCDLVGDGSGPIVIPFIPSESEANDEKVMPETITVDLCGHTIDRNLSKPTKDGYVIVVKGSLSLINGTVTGGNNSNILEGEGGGAIQVVNENLSDQVASMLTMEYVKIHGNEAVTGGGINVNNGILFMYNCEIFDNVAEKKGGGMYVFPGDAAGAEGFNEVILFNTKFHDNSASNGGGIFIQGLSLSALTEIDIYGNTATENGGGLYLNGGGVIIEKSNIYKNEAGGNGGGINVDWGGAEINDSKIYENVAGENGGGIYADGDPDQSAPIKNIVDITYSTVEKNVAGENGGGIFIASMLISTETNINGNEAGGNGGGICSIDGLSVTVQTGNINGNVAKEIGGGLYVEADDDTDYVELDYCEIKDNRANNAGGMYVSEGTLYLVGRESDPTYNICMIVENSAEKQYGAIWLVNDANKTKTSMFITGAVVIKENRVGNHFDDLRPEYCDYVDQSPDEETELWLIEGAKQVNPIVAECCRSDDKTKTMVIDEKGKITYLTRNSIKLDACGGNIQPSPYCVDGYAYPDDDDIVRELPTPTKPGYVFTGWFTDRNGGEEYVLGEKLTEDIVLYAHWQLDGKILVTAFLAVVAVTAACLIILLRKK